jgi:hypothetical protein
LRVIGRMHRNQLPLKMGRQFGDFQPLVGQHPLDIVAIGLAFRRLGQIEQAPIP